jgi:hypothetical protein
MKRRQMHQNIISDVSDEEYEIVRPGAPPTPPQIPVVLSHPTMEDPPTNIPVNYNSVAPDSVSHDETLIAESKDRATASLPSRSIRRKQLPKYLADYDLT